MIQPIAFLATIAGLGFSLFALLVDGTGVTGTEGAMLAAIGSLAALLGLSILVSTRLSGFLRSTLSALTILAAFLTALAGWFLMQDGVTVSMAVACLAILVVVARPRALHRI